MTPRYVDRDRTPSMGFFSHLPPAFPLPLCQLVSEPQGPKNSLGFHCCLFPIPRLVEDDLRISTGIENSLGSHRLTLFTSCKMRVMSSPTSLSLISWYDRSPRSFRLHWQGNREDRKSNKSKKKNKKKSKSSLPSQSPFPYSSLYKTKKEKRKKKKESSAVSVAVGKEKKKRAENRKNKHLLIGATFKILAYEWMWYRLNLLIISLRRRGSAELREILFWESNQVLEMRKTRHRWWETESLFSYTFFPFFAEWRGFSASSLFFLSTNHHQ